MSEEIFQPTITRAKFSAEVENFVMSTNCTYLDAIVTLAKKHDLEIEEVAKLLVPVLKQKLEVQASEVNLLPKVSSLPI